MTFAAANCAAGKHEAALTWFHFIFDPMTNDPTEGPKRFWRYLPFRQNDDLTRIDETLGLLTYTGSDPAMLKQKAELQASIQEWLDYPFNPHMLARRRPVIYMKYVFMKYLDNIIAWGDELFQRDTMESINQATQLYVLAANLLGPRLKKPRYLELLPLKHITISAGNWMNCPTCRWRSKRDCRSRRCLALHPVGRPH